VCIILFKVKYLSDSICLRLLSWFGSLKIKQIPKYQPPNVYGSVEIQMFIMCKNSTIPNCSNFDVRNEDRVYRHFIATSEPP
jgi:hypothetical protein